MALQKMLILRGNNGNAKAGYPDEQGNNVDWPIGALHVQAACEYASAAAMTPSCFPCRVSAKPEQSASKGGAGSVS